MTLKNFQFRTPKCGLSFLRAPAMLIAIAVAVSWSDAQSSTEKAQEVRWGIMDLWVPGEVIVEFHSGVWPQSSDDFVRELGLQARGLKLHHPMRANKTRKYLVRTHPNESVSAAIARLSSRKEVFRAQPNYIYRKAATVPNDTHYSELWAHKNSGQEVGDASVFGPDLSSAEDNPGASGVDLGLEHVWDRVTDCSSVVIAVIDTGIRYDHEDLAANMWSNSSYPNHGYDFLNGDSNPMDDDGHGTHVAGTIGAVGNNSKGVVGVCWKASLMAIKALGPSGGTSADIVDGIDFAVAQGAQVINMSLGTPSADASLEAALESARTNNVIVISAAGNDGTDNDSTPFYPCNYKKSNTLCVAAVTQANNLASFSNFGDQTVDVGAPGVNIVSAWHLKMETAIADNFSSGWTIASNTATTWGAQNRTTGSGSTPVLSVPSNWNGTVNYANSTTATAYKSFSFAGYSDVWFIFYVLSDLMAGDSIKSYFGSGAGNPTSGTAVGTYTGSTGGDALGYIYRPQSVCANATCALGFKFESNASGTSTGGLIAYLEMIRFGAGTTGYNMIDGTSMASPQVAGVVGLLKARNPGFTVAEIFESLLSGAKVAPALQGKTTTGKVIHAASALAYIRAPTGVTVQK